MTAKVTEIGKIILSEISKNMRKPPFSMFFPVFGAHLCDEKFKHSDNKKRHFRRKSAIFSKSATLGEKRGTLRG